MRGLYLSLTVLHLAYYKHTLLYACHTVRITFFVTMGLFLYDCNTASYYNHTLSRITKILLRQTVILMGWVPANDAFSDEFFR
jgi:hypothetical protein